MREAATIDVLSGGRLEVGIGAGYHQPEYEQTGIPLDPPGVRVGRLEEAIRILKGLWAEGPVTFAGRHYTITGLDGAPKPLQRPHQPIHVGAGGKRMLALAAREADSVGIIAQAIPGAGLDVAGDSEAALAQKVAWVREAVGGRFDQLELGMIIWRVVVTDHPRAAAEDIAAQRGLMAEQVLDSPHFLIGSVARIVERLLVLRERHGVSYFYVSPGDVEAFAPVVAQLAGT